MFAARSASENRRGSSASGSGEPALRSLCVLGSIPGSSHADELVAREQPSLRLEE
jgi:hypothetical protein